MATTLEKPRQTHHARRSNTKSKQTVSDIPLLGKTRHANLPLAALYEKAIERDEGILAAAGPLVVRTGKHTGRSPEGQVHRRRAGRPRQASGGAASTSRSREERYDALRQRFIDHMNEREVFVQDGFVGADPRIPPLACAPTPRPPGRASSATTCSSGRRADDLDGLRAQLHDHRRAHLPAPTRSATARAARR